MSGRACEKAGVRGQPFYQRARGTQNRHEFRDAPLDTCAAAPAQQQRAEIASARIYRGFILQPGNKRLYHPEFFACDVDDI
jgi:hypothetical protein